MSFLSRIFIKLFPKGEFKSAVKKGMKVGENVTIMGGVSFGSEPYLISIGSNVRISSRVSFINHDGGTFVFRHQEKYKNVIKYGKIKIGNNVFIGLGVIILPNVTIGNNCVIGAGSVVTKDIPDNSVACGTPAKVVMTIEQYAEKCLQKTPQYSVEEYLKNKDEFLKKNI